MKKEKTFDKRFWIITSVFIILITIILFFPYFFTRSTNFSFDFSETGQIGDTIGGITGPFIAIVAAALTFLAFWIQYKANRIQRNQFTRQLNEEKSQFNEQLNLQQKQFNEQLNLQQNQFLKNQFENRFYEMLRLYKENVNEMNIGENIKGRKCFTAMFKELRKAYSIIDERFKTLLSDEVIVNTNNNDDEKMKIAYQIFFHGIGDMSEKNYFEKLDKTKKKVIISSKSSLELVQKDYTNSKKLNKDSEYLYKYFDGNVHRLSHYFRHLYQTIKFICDQDFLDEEQKYSYLKTLRAQTSETEQLLIYYNAVAWFPEKWKGYFTKYRFIKNIPLGLADFYVNPRDYYKKEVDEYIRKGIAIFEENEIEAEKYRKK